MTDPRPEIEAFLQNTGWADAAVTSLAGDASLRRYWRLIRAGETAVLMDAPPTTGETTEPFVKIARYLSGLGYSAPRLHKTCAKTGLVLMEDIGDDLFARTVLRAPQTEAILYETAVQLLADLAQRPIPTDSATYDTEDMTSSAALASQWYAGTGTNAAITKALQRALEPLAEAPSALALRDFHAENLLWLPDRGDLARVGLLDFQDAMVAPVGYDLVSLLYDARRDVSAALIQPLMRQFGEAIDMTQTDLAHACAVLGAQRSLRILGVFARLSLHFGKPGYVDLIPRVWGHLESCVSHPALSDLAQACRTNLPPPEAAHLNDLRARCGTIPTL